MKKNWKDDNMLLNEASYEEYPDYSDAYYKVILTYNTKKERDEIFDWLKEISNEEMITLRKIDDDKIKVIKYISISFKDNENEDIEKWVEEIAEETDAVSTEMEETSYEEYHDTFIEKINKRNLKESKEEHKIYKYDRDCYFIDFENALDFVIRDVTRDGASRYVYDHYSSSFGKGITVFFGPKKENGEWAHIESIEEIFTLD